MTGNIVGSVNITVTLVLEGGNIFDHELQVHTLPTTEGNYFKSLIGLARNRPHAIIWTSDG